MPRAAAPDKPPRKRRAKAADPDAAKGPPSPGVEGAAEGSADPSGVQPDHADAPRGGVGPIGPEPTGAADTPPNRRKRKPRRASTKQIEEALSRVLSLPSLPMAVLGDEWAANHFATEGPNFAHEIAVAAERNDVLRKWCERLMQGETTAALMFAGLGYFYPLAVHFGAAPSIPMLGTDEIPVVQRRRRQPAAPPMADSGLGSDPDKAAPPQAHEV